MTRQDLKKALIVVHDLAMTALAVLVTFFVRFQDHALDERMSLLPRLLPLFVVYAGLVYWFFHLYRSRWRFASLPDLYNIFRAVSVLALTLLVLDYILVSPALFGFYYFGKITIALYWLVQMFLLGGPRLAVRYFKYARSRSSLEKGSAIPTLLLGRAADVELVLRAIEAGSVKKIQPKGILSYRSDDLGQSIRDIPVLGEFADLEQVVQDFQERGTAIRRLIATPTALSPEAKPELLLSRARKLGLPLMRLTSLGEGVRDAEILPLEIEDLLLRPTVQIDRQRLGGYVRGKRVLVTGGGGSIGSEICMRLAAFGADEILVVESSEPSLNRILESPDLAAAETKLDGVIADVRDRERMLEVMAEFKPDVVFHAAALKHVPYLEKDWAEGIKTNVFGSVNVANASVAAGVRAMVMISTDKAIDPVSMLGVTKRFAEMYAQALDAEYVQNGKTRLIAVRFGNVLGSVGSVVPKFKAQIARGGPLTVTHPDMVRYFMTIREASDLVITSASHADGEEGRQIVSGATETDERTSVYVLKMGQPVKIYDLAERMIRLAGFEPGEDVEINVTGMRPGERLHEILFAREEPMADIGIDGVMAAKPVFADRDRVQGWLDRLAEAVAQGNREAAEAVFEEAVPEFKRRKTAATMRPELAPSSPEAASPAP